MDVDGTLTDGKLYIGNQGEQFKVFDVKDGYGIKNILSQNHIRPIVLTARTRKGKTIKIYLGRNGGKR